MADPLTQIDRTPPSDGRMSDSKRSGDPSITDTQWRVFLGLAMLVATYVFRVEIVRFTLRLAARAVPSMSVWIKEFETQMLRPLSLVVFVLFIWFASYVMDLPSLLPVSSTVIAHLISLLLALPLTWTVIAFCNYVTWGISQLQGWNRTATANDDDYSRMMIVKEGIGVIKIILIAAVISSFVLDVLSGLASLDTTQISRIAALATQVVFVFSSHTWMKNVIGGLMALTGGQMRRGSHIRFLGHEGIVEKLFLQCFSVRRYDKALVYVPNGTLLDNTFEVHSKAMERRCVISLHLSKSTTSSQMRALIHELDRLLNEHYEHQYDKPQQNIVSASHPRQKDLAVLTRAFQHRNFLPSAKKTEEEPRFWICIEGPHLVSIVYGSQERHMIRRMEERTEIALKVVVKLREMAIEPFTIRLANDSTDQKLGKDRESFAKEAHISRRMEKKTTVAEESDADVGQTDERPQTVHRRKPRKLIDS